MCSHLASCNTGCPLQPKPGSTLLSCSRSPPVSSEKHLLGADAPLGFAFQGCGEGDFLSACPYSEHARLCAAHQDYRPVHRNGLRAQPSWSSHISLYIIMELLSEGKPPFRQAPTLHHQLQGVLPEGSRHGSEVAAGQAQRVRAAHRPPGRGSTPRQPPDTHRSRLYTVSKCCSTASAPCARKAARKAVGRHGGHEGD